MTSSFNDPDREHYRQLMRDMLEERTRLQAEIRSLRRQLLDAEIDLHAERRRRGGL